MIKKLIDNVSLFALDALIILAPVFSLFIYISEYDEHKLLQVSVPEPSSTSLLLMVVINIFIVFTLTILTLLVTSLLFAILKRIFLRIIKLDI